MRGRPRHVIPNVFGICHRPFTVLVNRGYCDSYLRWPMMGNVRIRIFFSILSAVACAVRLSRHVASSAEFFFGRLFFKTVDLRQIFMSAVATILLSCDSVWEIFFAIRSFGFFMLESCMFDFYDVSLRISCVCLSWMRVYTYQGVLIFFVDSFFFRF